MQRIIKCVFDDDVCSPIIVIDRWWQLLNWVKETIRTNVAKEMKVSWRILHEYLIIIRAQLLIDAIQTV